MKILVSALEPSANLHLKELLKYIDPSIKLEGIFDKELGNPIVDMQQKAIMGFVDAIKNLPFFFDLSNKMVELAKDAKVVLLMDSSGFNLPLAKKIKKNYPNKKIIYYILPQAWAWRRKRVYELSKNCDILASILPFEKDYYPKEANIIYVGHPLLDEIKEFKNNINPTIKNIALLPGSRRGEITKLMPIFNQFTKEMSHFNYTLVIPKKMKNNLEIYGDISKYNISFNTHKTLYNSDFALICSGTATLEAALIGTPFILTYKAKKLDFFIAKHLVKLNYIGLANIFFDKLKRDPLHPELIQEELNLTNLIENFKKFNREKFINESKILRDYLKYGSAQNVAKIINKIVS